MVEKTLLRRWLERIFLPKFHNSITKIVIYTGLGLFGKSILVWFIELFVAINFNTDITDNDSLWGFGLVVVGLIYNLISEERIFRQELSPTNARPNTDQKILDHDILVFQEFDKLLDEDFVTSFFIKTGGSATCQFDDQARLEDFIGEMAKTKYAFLTEVIENRRSTLVECTQDLARFLMYNFDSLDNSILTYSKMCRPEDNPYANREEYQDLDYNELYRMLQQQLLKMKKAYTDFRFEIKNSLYV